MLLFLWLENLIGRMGAESRWKIFVGFLNCACTAEKI